MSFIEERLLKETIAYALPDGLDGNAMSYAAPQTIKAAVRRKQTIVRNIDGDERVGSVEIASVVELPEHTRVWLDGVETIAASALVVIHPESRRGFRGEVYHKAVCA